MGRSRFAPVPLAPAIREADARLVAAAHPRLRHLLAALPGGDTTLWGIPFSLRPETEAARWLWLEPGTPERGLALDDAGASHVVVAHFALPADLPDIGSDPDCPASPVRGVGEQLATYTLEFADGTSVPVPIRRRFEVNDVLVDWGHLAFAARPHPMPTLVDWRGPHEDGRWFRNQQTVDWSGYTRWLGGEAPGNYWLHSIVVPDGGGPLRSISFRPAGGTVGIGGLTLFRGSSDPLRHAPRKTVLITGRGVAGAPITVDLGVLGHRVERRPPGPAWTRAAVRGWGEAPGGPSPDEVVVQLTASPDAMLSVGDALVPVAGLATTEPDAARDRGILVQLLPEPEMRVRVRVIDEASGRETPARVHFRSADGRYLPPSGHRREVNDRWFEDYGADCLLGATPYAYVPGAFDVDLPRGQVHVEVVRGFDTDPLRATVEIGPETRELSLPLVRRRRRAEGWLSADTHVHFLSPDTALLEAKAEDVQIVNLLASQWGDLYTNVGDYTGRMSGCSDSETIVWVGTENRQHLLGHLSLLGRSATGPGRMAAAGPPESDLGDPVGPSLAEWSDAARGEGALVIVPHFPVPYAEVVADVALGKVDGLEVRDFHAGVDSYGVGEYYRLLNAGFRVAVVGGTDKMSAGMPLGGVRTYARVGDGGVDFHRWAEAVRAGRTMTSSGPFIELHVDGVPVGGELVLPPAGGTVEVQAIATAPMPLARLQVVHNGQVAAEAVAGTDPRAIALTARVKVERDGWIAARCDGPDLLWHEWPVRPAAHTSPVYLVGARDRAAGADLTFLQTILDGGLTWLDRLATTAESTADRRLRATFLEAKEALREREDAGLRG